MQMKLYRTQDATPVDLIGVEAVYRFSGNKHILGLGFRPDPEHLRSVSLQAARQHLSPMMLGAEAYLRLIDIADQTGLLLGGVSLEPTLDEDEECDLVDYVSRVRDGYGTGPLKAFLNRLVSEVGVTIRAISFLVDSKDGRTVKVTVHYNGVLSVTNDREGLPAIDPALSLLADYRPGYQQT